MHHTFLTDNPVLYEKRFPDPDHIAGRFVADILDRYGIESGTVLDLGCGTGRDLGYLRTRGFRGIGLDASTRMLAHAAARHGVTTVEGDLREFDLDVSVDAVICLDSSLLYCHTDNDLESCLSAVRRHLRPGGILVAEMRNGAYYLGETDLLGPPRPSSVRVDGDTYEAITSLTVDHRAQLLRRHRRWSLRRDDGSIDTGFIHEDRTAWRLLFPLEITGHVRRAGLELLELFDTPGPRTDEGWPGRRHRDPGVTTLSGDRLHLVARRPLDSHHHYPTRTP